MLKGFITIYNGKELSFIHNDVVYQGHDIVSKALAGEARINGMYIKYCNGVPAEPSLDKAITYNHYVNLTSPYGFCRKTLDTAPAYDNTDASYLTNKVYFKAEFNANDHAGGALLLDGTSQIFEVALVYIEDPEDITRDKIYSVGFIRDGGTLDPKTKLANMPFGVNWSAQSEEGGV